MNRTITAHHEAGHAVGAFVQGVPIVSATIEGSGVHRGLVRLRHIPRTFKQHHAHGIVSLCGDAAQRRYAASSLREHYASTDRRNAVTLALQLVGSSEAADVLVRLWLIQARDLIENHWVAVSVLAAALLEQGTMSDLAVRQAIVEVREPEPAVVMTGGQTPMRSADAS